MPWRNIHRQIQFLIHQLDFFLSFKPLSSFYSLVGVSQWQPKGNATDVLILAAFQVERVAVLFF